MKQTLVLMCVVLALAASVLAQQPAAPRHLVGQSISQQMRFDTKAQTTAATATLTFAAADGGPTVTIDFLSQYKLQAPRTPPTAVDIVVTQHTVDEGTAAMTLRANGELVPLITRFRSARAVVSTISFDEFERLATAATLVEQAFDSDLEFSPQQLRMLSKIADGWAGR